MTLKGWVDENTVTEVGGPVGRKVLASPRDPDAGGLNVWLFRTMTGGGLIVIIASFAITGAPALLSYLRTLQLNTGSDNH